MTMKRILLLLIGLATCFQLSAQDSLNMSFQSRWDVDTLVSFSADGNFKFNDIWGYVDCQNNEYAIIGSASKIHFINVNDPKAPFEVASFAGGDTTVWRDMKTYKDRAYAVSDATTEGLMIFDLSDLPNSISLSNQTNADFGNAHNIYVEEATGRLYVVGAGTADILIYDIETDPDNPILLAANSLLVGSGATAIGGYVHDIYVRDNIGYCSHGQTNSYVIWSFATPTDPKLIASTLSSGYNHSSWVTEDGQYAIYAEEVGLGLPLGVVDLTNMFDGDIETNHTFKEPLLAPEHLNATPHNPFIRDNYLIVSYYEDGLQIWDITDPLNPVKAAYYDTNPSNESYTGYSGNWGVYPYLPSGIMLTSHIREGLIIVTADSLEFDTIITPSYPSTEIPNAAITDLCFGDSVNLAIEDNAEAYKWYNGNDSIGIEHSISVNSTGSYWVTAQNGHCMLTSDTVDIMVNPLPVTSILSSGPTEFCDGETVYLTVPNTSSISWSLDDAIIGSTDSLLASTAGSYNVQVINEFNCSGSNSIDIEVYNPVVPTITADANLLSATSAPSYQWFVDGEAIMGATNQMHVAIVDGDYYVETTDANSCVATSNTINRTPTNINELSNVKSLALFPNPVQETLSVRLETESSKALIYQLNTVTGKLLQRQSITVNGETSFEIDMNSYPKGIYLLQFMSGKEQFTTKIVKQ